MDYINPLTGEITQGVSPIEAAELWRRDWETNPSFRALYTSDYIYPKPSPDTAKDIETLRSLCSDKTRTGRGDTGYLLDFMLSDSFSITEGKMLTLICTKGVVWSYCVCTWEDIMSGMGLSKKQTKRVYDSLIEKGMIKELCKKFRTEDSTLALLIKVHPKLYWKGRYSAYIAALQESYEGLDDVL